MFTNYVCKSVCINWSVHNLTNSDVATDFRPSPSLTGLFLPLFSSLGLMSCLVSDCLLSLGVVLALTLGCRSLLGFSLALDKLLSASSLICSFSVSITCAFCFRFSSSSSFRLWRICSLSRCRIRCSYKITAAEVQLITKPRLFKYIENFTSKNWNFSD